MFRGQKINKKTLKSYLLKQPSKKKILSAIIIFILLVPVFLEFPMGKDGVAPSFKRLTLWWHCSSFEISSTFQSLLEELWETVWFGLVFSEGQKPSSSLTHRDKGSPVYIFEQLVVFKTFRELPAIYLTTATKSCEILELPGLYLPGRSKGF